MVAAMMTTTATTPPMMAPVLSVGLDDGEVTSGPTGTEIDSQDKLLQ